MRWSSSTALGCFEESTRDSYFSFSFGTSRLEGLALLSLRDLNANEFRRLLSLAHFWKFEDFATFLFFTGVPEDDDDVLILLFQRSNFSAKVKGVSLLRLDCESLGFFLSLLDVAFVLKGDLKLRYDVAEEWYIFVDSSTLPIIKVEILS